MGTEADPQHVVEAMWQRDSTAQRLGITVIESGLGTATCEMTVDDRHIGSQEVAHGGLLFTFADIAMSYAGNSFGGYALATGASINFVSAAKLGDRLIARAVEHSLRGKAGIYDVTVRDAADGHLVATFRGNTLRIA